MRNNVSVLIFCQKSLKNIGSDFVIYRLSTAEFVSAQTSCPYPGLFVCNLCRKEFKHSKWLQTHMKSHSNWIKVIHHSYVIFFILERVNIFINNIHFPFSRPIVKSSHSVRFALGASRDRGC